MAKRRNLDAAALLFSAQDVPPGYQLLLGYLREIRSGKIPKTVTTRQLAKAFEAILFDSAEPLTVLKLRRRGAPKKRMLESLAEYEANQTNGKIVAFIEQQLEEGLLVTHVYESAAETFGKSRRQIERIWKIWKGFQPFFPQRGKFGDIADELARSFSAAMDIDGRDRRHPRTSAARTERHPKRARARTTPNTRHDT